MHKGNRTARENVSEGDVYYGNINSRQRFPYRSFSPELFDDAIFNEGTDVWAYGVTLIEMYQLGSKPYPGIDNPAELMHFLKLGKIHTKPYLCPEDMYANIIQACFSQRVDRPTFTTLAAQLHQFKLSAEGSITTETSAPENFTPQNNASNSIVEIINYSSQQPLRPGFTSQITEGRTESLPNDPIGVISQSYNQIISSPLREAQSGFRSQVSEGRTESLPNDPIGITSQPYNQSISSPLQDLNSQGSSDIIGQYSQYSYIPTKADNSDSEVPDDEITLTTTSFV